MGYCALAKLAAGPERAGQLEARYMQIVNTYRDKDTVRAYPELLAIAAQAIAQGGCDFFGEVATSMELLNAKLGQFFTPYDVSRMIAEMSLQDAGFPHRGERLHHTAGARLRRGRHGGRRRGCFAKGRFRSGAAHAGQCD